MKPGDYKPSMGKIKRVRCELKTEGSHICQVDDEGCGSCGDAIYDNGYPCMWIEEILEFYQEKEKG